jgi:hypothetical protein
LEVPFRSDEFDAVKNATVDFSLKRKPLEGVTIALELEPDKLSIYNSDIDAH